MGQSPQKAQRAEFRNIGISDLRNYRLPLAGKVSILHRISGLGLFLFLPLIMALIVAVFTSEQKFAVAHNILTNPLVKNYPFGFDLGDYASCGCGYSLYFDGHAL